MNFNNQYYQPYNVGNRSNGIIWVQGVEGAKAYQLAPNSNILLMDSESDNFYIKTSDNIGMCNLRTFNYKEVIDTPKPTNYDADMSIYVTRDELSDFIERAIKDYEQSVQSTKSESKSTTNYSNQTDDRRGKTQ